MNDSAPKEVHFPLVLNLASEDSPTAFNKMSEVRNWALAEETLWGEVVQFIPNAGRATENIKRYLVECGANLRKAAEGVLELRNDERAFDTFWRDFKVYADGRTLAAQTALGEYVRMELPHNPLGCLGAILFATTMHKERKLGTYIDAETLEELEQRGDAIIAAAKTASSRVSPNPSSIESHLAKLAEDLQRMKDEVAAQRERVIEKDQEATETIDRLTLSAADLNQTMAVMKADAAEVRHDFSTKITALNAETDELRAKAELRLDEALKAMQTSFMSNQSLKAPAALWKDKFKDHQRQMSASLKLWATSAVLVVMIASLMWLAFAKVAGGNYAWWMAPAGIAYFTLAFWWLRIVSKLFFSAQHLMEDAREREVMTLGLFALAANPDAVAAVKSEPISRTIDVLYKPTTKGVIDDHAPGIDPNRLIDGLAKIMRK